MKMFFLLKEHKGLLLINTFLVTLSLIKCQTSPNIPYYSYDNLAYSPTSYNYDYNYNSDKDYIGNQGNSDIDLANLEGLVYNFLSSSLKSDLGNDVIPSGQSMASAARILTYPYQQSNSYRYAEYPEPKMGHQHQQIGYGHQQGYGYQQQPQKGYHQQQPSGYGMKHQSGYDDDHHDDGYGYKPKKKKRKIKKVFVPIVIRKKKPKKRKTIAVYKGFYIQGGTQIFGKFKKIKDCKKACEITPNCFAADYNPWLKKCYIHTNVSACEEMRTHPKLIHFKKVPCDLLETPRGLITLGVRIYGGLEQKGIKNLQDCIKKCATAGQGIAPDQVPVNLAKQVCFGVDYDFASHKCYFHTDETLCPPVEVIPTPVQVVEAPSVINILLCPITSVTT